MKTAKIGLIGLGRQGEQHAINIATRIQGCEFAAVCDIDEAKMNRLADRYGIKHRVKTFEELAAIKELDALVIVSPSVFHARQIEQALAAGKHVFSEKPLGVSLEECIATKKVVESYPDRFFMLGFMRRFDASYRYAQQKIAAGDIGKVVLFRAYSQDPIKYIKGVIAYGPTSGGQFLDMSVHDIDLARWMLGSEPERIWAIGGCYAYPEFGSYGDGDNVSALMKFKDGAMGFLFAGRTANHGYNIEKEIIGTKATLRIASVPQANLVEILDQHGVRRECHDNFLERFEYAYLNEMQEFINCLNENRRPGLGVEDGYRASLVAYKCREAFETGNLVDTGL